MKKLILSLSSLLILAGCGSNNNTVIHLEAQETPTGTVNAFYEALLDESDPNNVVKALVYVDVSADVTAAIEEELLWGISETYVTSFQDPYATVEYTIVEAGETDTETDQVELIYHDDQWWIVDLPQ